VTNMGGETFFYKAPHLFAEGIFFGVELKIHD
jgi:hypothetical protein